MDVFKEFHFDAAHHMGMNVPAGHPYGRLHGHSFTACLTLRGEPDKATGWVMDFAEIDKAIDRIRHQLDHNYLNDITGLEIPSLENICLWIWKSIAPEIPLLYSVSVKRGTLGEGCIYYRKDERSSSFSSP